MLTLMAFSLSVGVGLVLLLHSFRSRATSWVTPTSIMSSWSVGAMSIYRYVYILYVILLLLAPSTACDGKCVGPQMYFCELVVVGQQTTYTCVCRDGYRYDESTGNCISTYHRRSRAFISRNIRFGQIL